MFCGEVGVKTSPCCQESEHMRLIDCVLPASLLCFRGVSYQIDRDGLKCCVYYALSECCTQHLIAILCSLHFPSSWVVLLYYQV